jgi:exodeoxyribonuclease VII small subunit
LPRRGIGCRSHFGFRRHKGGGCSSGFSGWRRAGRRDRRGALARADPGGILMSEQPLTFEAAMSRLEEIVADLESGKLSLEDSLKKFEEGITLGKTCREFLDRADVRIRTLTTAVNGEPVEEDATDGE